MFWLSLFNFLNAIFESLPQPRLMCYEAEQQKMKNLTEENAKLREQVNLNMLVRHGCVMIGPKNCNSLIHS